MTLNTLPPTRAMSFPPHFYRVINPEAGKKEETVAGFAKDR
jgi:hypothetical protein